MHDEPHEASKLLPILALRRAGKAAAALGASLGLLCNRMTILRILRQTPAPEQQGMKISKTATTRAMTPHRAVGLMLRRDEDLSRARRRWISQVCQLHPSVMQAHTLFRFFAQMVRERRGEELDRWMYAAFHSGIPELRCPKKHRASSLLPSAVSLIGDEPNLKEEVVAEIICDPYPFLPFPTSPYPPPPLPQSYQNPLRTIELSPLRRSINALPSFSAMTREDL